MADIYWPAGVGDMPERDSLQWQPVESGEFATMQAGAVRGAPRALGFSVTMVGSYPMSMTQFKGLFLPWWKARASSGGCDNGMTPFWLRDPYELIPYRWVRQEGQTLRPVPDGLGFMVQLPLLRLPQ
jgi:hypothetical protein